MRSNFPPRRSRRRGRSTSTNGVTGLLQVLAKSGVPAAGALDTECELLSIAEALSPALRLQIAGRGSSERELPAQLPERVECCGVVALLVGIHSKLRSSLPPHRLGWSG
jgi:hypothetical protein